MAREGLAGNFKFDGSQFKPGANREKTLSDFLNKNLNSEIQLKVIVSKGELRVEGADKAGKELAAAVNKAFGLGTGNSKNNTSRIEILARIGLNSKVTFTGGKATMRSIQEKQDLIKIGGLANAKGRYFEYLLFKELEKKYVAVGGTIQKDNAEYSGYSEIQEQSKFGDFPGVKQLDTAIKACVADAMKVISERFTPQQIRDNILKALAGSNPAGDISAFGITLELKLTSGKKGEKDFSNVKYFELKDKENFGYGLISYLKNNYSKGRNPKLWMSANQFLKAKDWTDNVASLGFREYLYTYLIQKENVKGESIEVLNYLLQKGNFGAGLSLEQKINKTIIVGVTGSGNGNYSILIDLDSVIENLRNLENAKTLLGYPTQNNFTQKTWYMTWREKQILSLYADPSTISSYAKPDRGEAAPKQMGGNEVTLIMRLNKAFFEMANELGAQFNK